MPDNDPQPSHSELALFGEELKREREIRGISIKEISDATKISKRFLEAIERNDHKTLPAPVFTRGFVREYARYLGLNIEEMVNRYNFAAAGDDRIEHSPHLDRLVTAPPPTEPTKPRPKQGIPPPYKRIDKSVFVVAALVIALAAVSWWAIQHKRQMRAAEAENRPADARPQAPPPKPAVVTATTATPPETQQPMHMVLELTDDSYITLLIDGKAVIDDEMRGGDRRTFDANDEIRFKTVGNAAAVTVTIDNVQIPPFGRDGQVVHNRVFTRDSIKKLADTETSGRT
jgi:transcriptional regulator with XRE-family HTH domain